MTIFNQGTEVKAIYNQGNQVQAMANEGKWISPIVFSVLAKSDGVGYTGWSDGSLFPGSTISPSNALGQLLFSVNSANNEIYKVYFQGPQMEDLWEKIVIDKLDGTNFCTMNRSDFIYQWDPAPYNWNFWGRVFTPGQPSFVANTNYKMLLYSAHT